MADSAPNAGPTSPDDVPPRPRNWQPWLLLVVLALLAGGAALAYWWPGSDPAKQPAPSGDQPLTGKLTVVVRPPERAVEPLEVEEPGAVPVRVGGMMSLQVQLEPPACAYLVWIDTEGQVVPLYPWNHETIEVRDLNGPVPTRRAATTIHNPPIGGGWKFGKKGGVETVLLLARRGPLDPGTRLGPLIDSVPPPKVRHRGEVAVLGLDRGADGVSTLFARNRGPDEEARAADEPLRAAMVRLRDHFELIRAVRFAHVEE